MPKASHVENTPTPNRRSILAGAGGIAAAGALSTTALALPAGGIKPSALVLEHRRLVRGSVDESDAGADVRLNRLVEVGLQIMEVPVRSWADVIARAEVAAYWSDGDGSFELDENGNWLCPEFPPDHPSMDDRSVVGLISAVLTMAKGGANV